MLARENVTGSAHIGCKLVNFVNVGNRRLGERLFPKISENKFIGRRFSEFMPFDIDGPYPKAFLFQAFYQVSPDKSSRSINQNSFHFPCRIFA
jgi:hypothetical protein